MDLLLLPMRLFLWLPPAAFLVATPFWYLFFQQRWRGGSPVDRIRLLMFFLPALGWSAYGIYETLMWFWVLTVTATIRVDLLLLQPIMVALLLMGLSGMLMLRKI